MTTFTVPRLLGRVGVLVLTAVALGLVFGGSALARSEDSIHVAKPVGAKRNAVYNVVVSGFSNRQGKAYLFVDYKRCAATLVAETAQASPHEKKVYNVRGAFTRVSGWISRASKLDHACVYLVNPKTGQLLASGGTGYLVH
jgi:hypothetical protein